MKLFYSLIISLFISNVLQSQSFQTDERVWNSATQRAFSDLGRAKLTKPALGNIIGSEYYETEFKEGEIVHLDKNLEIKTSLRYNAYNDEIELIDMSGGTKSVKAAIKNSRIISFFDNNEYNYLKYLDSKNIASSGYLIPVFKGLKIEIHERKRKKFIKGKASVNSFDIEHKPKFVDDIQYFLSYKGSTPEYIKITKKSILKFFNKSEEILNFIKKNKIKNGDLTSLIKIVEFYENNSSI